MSAPSISGQFCKTYTFSSSDLSIFEKVNQAIWDWAPIPQRISSLIPSIFDRVEASLTICDYPSTGFLSRCNRKVETIVRQNFTPKKFDFSNPIAISFGSNLPKKIEHTAWYRRIWKEEIYCSESIIDPKTQLKKRVIQEFEGSWQNQMYQRSNEIGLAAIGLISSALIGYGIYKLYRKYHPPAPPIKTLPRENRISKQENSVEPAPEGAIVLAEGESFDVEPGGMLAYKNLKVETKSSTAGLWSILKRYVFGGETLFINTFTAEKGGGWIALEENQPGQIASSLLQPGGAGFVIRNGAYLACNSNVQLETKIAGLRNYMKGKGIATTTAKVKEGDKPGRVYFHTPSGIAKKFHIAEHDIPIVIDNNMILGHTEGLKVSLKKVGGIHSFFFSGEGLASEFKGDGDIYVGSGTQSDGSNALHVFVKSSGEQIGDWLGKGICATALAGVIYSYLPEEAKNEIPHIIYRIIKKL